MEVARAAQVGVVDHGRAHGWAWRAFEVVGEDRRDALVGERSERDGSGRDGFDPGGIEASEEAQHAQAGPEALLGMWPMMEHRDDEASSPSSCIGCGATAPSSASARSPGQASSPREDATGELNTTNSPERVNRIVPVGTTGEAISLRVPNLR